MSQRVAPARSAQSKPTQTVSTRQLGQASARPAQSIVDRVQDILQWNSERKKCPASPASPSVVEAECKRVVQLNHGERIAGVPGIIGMAGLIFSNMTSRNFLSATLFQIPTDRSMYFTLLLWTTSPRPSPDPKPQQAPTTHKVDQHHINRQPQGPRPGVAVCCSRVAGLGAAPGLGSHLSAVKRERPGVRVQQEVDADQREPSDQAPTPHTPPTAPLSAPPLLPRRPLAPQPWP